MYELTQRFVIEQAFGTEPLLMETTESSVRDLLKILKSHPSKSLADYVGYQSVADDPEMLAFWGFSSDNNWLVSVYRDDALKHVPLYTVYGSNREQLQSLAMFLSKYFPTARVQLEKWARIRSIWVNQKLVRDFRDVPYTNGPSDWI